MPAPGSFAALCVALLREGRAVRFRASGDSMAPALRDGDLVTVTPIAAAAARVGDVLLYLAPRGLTAHRVVAAATGSPAALLTRGDAPGSACERVAAEQVLGCVQRVERHGRERALPRRPPGRAVALVVRARRVATRCLTYVRRAAGTATVSFRNRESSAS